MNKTELKTFVCSFVITLSAIISVDKAFFYTPQMTEEAMNIPSKNITLFFSQPHPQTFSSSIEPVQKVALETPDYKPEELVIAQNMPNIPESLVVQDIPELASDVEIPLQVEKREINLEDQSFKNEQDLPDMPLIYAGIEKQEKPLSNAQKEMSESPILIQKAESEADNQPDLRSQPMVIRGTRKIIKFDNAQKKYQEIENNSPAVEEQEESKIAQNDMLEEKIPLQNSAGKENVFQEEILTPPLNQVASLEGNASLVDAETQLAEDETEKPRTWQTMAEKHHDKNPWVVARGSKFVKNKKVLEESFSSKAMQKKADNLLSVENKTGTKTTKVAVQDNLLIPIPQELLDEDNLVPDVSNDNPSAKKPSKKTEKKKGSFLNNLTSVFSKENREKAIKNIREKSNQMLAAKGKTKRTQILPTEIRLSFQPNRAEISGQTLRWVQAFAKKTTDEDDVGLEIRIDGSHSFELQQKRLNLLYNILTANDVPYQKINTVFADREPNSFVMRTVKIVQNKGEKKEDESWKQYYQKW